MLSYTVWPLSKVKWSTSRGVGPWWGHKGAIWKVGGDGIAKCILLFVWYFWKSPTVSGPLIWQVKWSWCLSTDNDVVLYLGVLVRVSPNLTNFQLLYTEMLCGLVYSGVFLIKSFHQYLTGSISTKNYQRESMVYKLDLVSPLQNSSHPKESSSDCVRRIKPQQAQSLDECLLSKQKPCSYYMCEAFRSY